MPLHPARPTLTRLILPSRLGSVALPLTEISICLERLSTPSVQGTGHSLRVQFTVTVLRIELSQRSVELAVPGTAGPPLDSVLVIDNPFLVGTLLCIGSSRVDC
jgi:hypothetical protein